MIRRIVAGPTEPRTRRADVIALSPLNLQGWLIDADDGQRRVLPSYSLGAGKTVRLHTGSGANGSGRIYLGFKMPIWNNSGGDTGRLYDPNGVLASTYRY